jgi:hypothetical protein
MTKKFLLTGKHKCNTVIIAVSTRQPAEDSGLPKRRGPGRPKLPKAEAKGRIVPIRFSPEVLKAMTAKARKKNQTLSAWIRDALSAALQEGGNNTA